MFSRFFRPQRFVRNFSTCRREVLIDVETTGLNHYKDRIVEICAREYINNKPGITWHTYINPCGKMMSKQAAKCNQISPEILNNSLTFKNIYNQFLNFVGDSKIIAHNAQFDIHFLNSELKRIKQFPLQNEKLCTLKLARNLFPNEINNLDVLCDRFNIDRTTRIKNGHNAHTDTELLHQVYEKLLQEAKTNENYYQILKNSRYHIPNNKWM